MTEAEWNECDDPQKMLEFLPGKASDRRLWLFAAACCRRAWSLLIDKRSRQAVEAVENMADGLIDDLSAALEQANEVVSPLPDERAAAARAAQLAANPSAELSAYFASQAAASAEKVVPSRARGQSGLLRCIFGPLPFRPITLDPNWITSPAKQLAEAIYLARAFDRLPVLADALEDAGCNQQDVLQHCRQPGEHVRGCWVVDLLTGRE
jgi:hypothetical protein